MTKTTFISIFLVFIIALIPSISLAEEQQSDQFAQGNISVADLTNASANPMLDPNAAKQGNSNGAYNDNATLPGANDDESVAQGGDGQDNLGLSSNDMSSNNSGY